jgi:hypothetical protein
MFFPLFLAQRKKGRFWRSFFGFVALVLFYRVGGKLNAFAARDSADWNVLFAEYFAAEGLTGISWKCRFDIVADWQTSHSRIFSRRVNWQYILGLKIETWASGSLWLGFNHTFVFTLVMS